MFPSLYTHNPHPQILSEWCYQMGLENKHKKREKARLQMGAALCCACPRLCNTPRPEDLLTHTTKLEHTPSFGHNSMYTLSNIINQPLSPILLPIGCPLKALPQDSSTKWPPACSSSQTSWQGEPTHKHTCVHASHEHWMPIFSSGSLYGQINSPNYS